MQALLNAMLQDSSIREMAGQFKKKQGQAFVYGLAGTQKHSAFAACYLQNTAVIITSGSQELSGWREDLQSLLPDTEVVELPVLDMAEFNAAAKGLHRLARRMEVLGRLLKGDRLVVLATV